MPRQEKFYLIARADRSIRVITSSRTPRLRQDEVAFPLLISFPDGWGKVLPTNIEVTLPDFTPTVEVVVTEPTEPEGTTSE